ncbi:MAG: DNA primase [Firmicutes bacterium]|nr:DNA primase [Bacillota bacterium]
MSKRPLPPDFIEQVKLSNNIVQVASRYMTLKAQGRQHWGLCPFHHEKTPSFSINENQQFYYCFGCHAGGNVIGLVKQLESTDYIGAIELLAKWANLELPEIKVDAKYLQNKKKKEVILEILESVREFYCKNLYLEKSKHKLEYLHNRGITDELIKTFNIGASHDWDEIVSYLRKKGYKDQDIVDSGVAASSDKGKVYDAMAERITFAIFDIYGSCIGFTGRTLSNDKNIAKYRNTAQTMVFDKSNIVYGVDVLKKNKLSNVVDKLIVVEGNVDVISLVGEGFHNTVACMGTALTPFHAKIFKRFSPNIYLCFDGDESGRRAALRSLDILEKEEGTKVRVISLPHDVDPDSFVKENGVGAFHKLIEEAKPLIDYKLDVLEEYSNLNDNLGKAEYLKKALEILKPLDKTSEIELYLPKVSRISGISIDGLRNDLNKAGNKAKPAESIVNQVHLPPVKDGNAQSLDFVMACILHDKVEASELEHIQNNLYKRISQIIYDKKRDNKKWKLGDIFDELEEDELAQINHLLDWNFNNTLDIKSEFEIHLARLESAGLELMRSRLMQSYSQEKNTEEREKINRELGELSKKIRSLKYKRNEQ